MQNYEGRKFTRYILGLIFVFGLLLRLCLVSFVAPYPERYVQADAVGYDRLAINLAEGRGFSRAESEPYRPDNFRTPIYPLFLAAVYSLLGYRPDIVLWIQAFAGALTIPLAYAIALRIGGRRSGLIAAVLLALSPHSITYTALLWSDTLYTLLFTVSILLTLLMLAEDKLAWLILAGIFAGLSVLVHPRSLFLPYLFAALLIIAMQKRKIPRIQQLVWVISYILVFNIVLLPWRIRNYAAFGVPNVSSAAGLSMLYYGAALTESAETGEDQWTIVDQYEAEIREMPTYSINEAHHSQLAFRLGVQKILRNPWTYAKIHTTGMARIFLPGTSQIQVLLTGERYLEPASIYEKFLSDAGNTFAEALDEISGLQKPVVAYIFLDAIYLAIVYLFSIYSVIKIGWSRLDFWSIVLTLVYLAAVSGAAGAPRFRVAMMPLLSALAAGGILLAGKFTWEKFSQGRNRIQKNTRS